MNRFKLLGICVLTSTLALSGCVARTYNLTRDRVDQDLTTSSGNRGYIMGVPPEAGERKTTRTTRVFEIELGLAKKSNVKCPTTTAPIVSSMEEPASSQEYSTETTSGDYEQYTVGKNDTLQKISKKFTGTTKNWMKIYEANKNVLSTPDKLYPGQILNIPTNLSSEKVTQSPVGTEVNLK
jgi:LysM repeat protein